MFTARVNFFLETFFRLSFFVRSQPILMCRQCPGYKADVSQLLFATGSNYWFPGLPAPAPLPPPPKPAATEGCAKAAGEQPSTSSDGPSGDAEYLHLKFSHIHCWNSKNGSRTVIKSLSILTLQICPFAPSLSAAPQEYSCPPRGIHVICTCCLQPMPDRRAELSSQRVAQQCEWYLKPLTVQIVLLFFVFFIIWFLI